MPLNINFAVVDLAIRFLKPFVEQRAYLDPGSGSFLLQLLIAALLGGLFLLKTYWGKVVSFFRRLFKRQESEEDSE
jgi:hypothetical protein